jgi:hypothetical protein
VVARQVSGDKRLILWKCKWGMEDGHHVKDTWIKSARKHSDCRESRLSNQVQ